jgi:hypothetical protein
MTGDDERLLFTAAQLWAAMPFDVYAQCLGADVTSEEVDALKRSRTKLGAAACAPFIPSPTFPIAAMDVSRCAYECVACHACLT